MLLKAPIDFAFQDFSPRWVITSSWLSGSLISILHSSSIYSFNLFLTYSASARCMPFLAFIGPIFAWNVPSHTLIFLGRYLVFPILLFSSIFFFFCTDHLGRLFLNLFLLFFGTLYSHGYAFLLSFDFCFSSFLGYLYHLLRQPFCLFTFHLLVDGLDVVLTDQKTQIITASFIASWKIRGETMKTVRDFIFLGSKITEDSDCSCEKRDTCSLKKKKKSYEKPWKCTKKQRHSFTTKRL